MKLIKKVAVILFLVILFVFLTCQPVEPEADLIPYMSDISYIPSKVYAKGKGQKLKIKTLKREFEEIGTFTLTAYCACPKCCGNSKGITASGTHCQEGRTVAVDPKLIPYGTTLKINDHIYVAEDCGSAIKGKHIDIYFEDHQEALDFGKQKATVYQGEKIKLKGVISKWKSLWKSMYQKNIRNT